MSNGLFCKEEFLNAMDDFAESFQSLIDDNCFVALRLYTEFSHREHFDIRDRDSILEYLNRYNNPKTLPIIIGSILNFVVMFSLNGQFVSNMGSYNAGNIDDIYINEMPHIIKYGNHFKKISGLDMDIDSFIISTQYKDIQLIKKNRIKRFFGFKDDIDIPSIEKLKSTHPINDFKLTNVIIEYKVYKKD